MPGLYDPSLDEISVGPQGPQGDIGEAGDRGKVVLFRNIFSIPLKYIFFLNFHFGLGVPGVPGFPGR